MAHLTIHVPEEHVDDLRRELVRAHAERVEALRRALAAYADSHDRLDRLEGLTVEIGDLHAAIEQLGWSPRPRSAAAVTAHPEVLADAVDQLLTAGPVPDARLVELARRIDEGR